jgi:hypothetical protein
MSSKEESGNKGEDGAPHAELREWVFGSLPNQDDDSPAHEWAGEIDDPDVRQYLSFAAEVVDDGEEFDDFQKSVRGIHTTEAVHKSIQTGNMARAAYMSGLVGYQQDVSGMRVLMSLMNMIENIPVFVGYIYGIMGAGKTNFAMLLLEVFISVYGRDNVYLAANVTSKDLDEEIDHYSRIVEILEDRRERIQNGEELDTFVMVIDEAAQIFTGSGSDQHKAKQLAKILKLARKSDANLILIGHDGKDIGPSLRALCTLFVHKESQTTATFYRDVRNRQGIGEMMSLSGITPTNIQHSTWDEGEFIFDADADGDAGPITDDDIEEMEKEHEKEMMAILATTTEMTNEAVADKYDTSEATVRRAIKANQGKLDEIGINTD